MFGRFGNALANCKGWCDYLKDPNGLWMHVIYGSPGIASGFIDVFLFGLRPKDALLLGAAGVCLIPPFLLPVAGIDRKEERIELFFLTFGLSSALMTILGIGLGALFAGDVKITDDSWSALSLVWAYLNALAVIISFGRVGHLSRDQRHRLYEPLLWQMPPVIRTAHLTLKLDRSVVLADKMARSLFGMTKLAMLTIVSEGRLGPVAEEVVGELRQLGFLYVDQLEKALLGHPGHIEKMMGEEWETVVTRGPQRKGGGIK